MKEKLTYLVPDYYPDFKCKMGACRTCCCEGWPISITMQDYFRLLGVECSPELRRRIDTGLHILPHSTEDRYAQIGPRFDGNCPMRMEDGRCALHAELGGDVLSQVCRLYPRGIWEEDGSCEACCANSCEGVLEMMFACKEPLDFIPVEMDADLAQHRVRDNHFETAGRECDIRLYFIRKMQDRALHLPRRIMKLGMAMKDMDEAILRGDHDRVDALLGGAEPAGVSLSEKAPEDRLDAGLVIAEEMLEIMDQTSHSVRDYGEASLRYFGRDEHTHARYEQARARFEAMLPDWEIYFEHMLVNHMFFEKFPYQDRPEGMLDEFIAICAVYSMLRFLAIGWMAQHDGETDFVDVCAAAFRLIDHTSFDRNASRVLRRLNCCGAAEIYNLILL